MTCKSAEIAHKLSSRVLDGPVAFPAALKIEAFPLETGAKFLLTVLGKPYPTHDDEAVALRISKSVGGLPLALDLIGSLIRRWGTPVQRFIQEHPTFERDILFQPELKEMTENTYQQTIAVALGLSQSTDRPLSEAARLFMHMLSFLDEDGAPLSLLKAKKRGEM